MTLDDPPEDPETEAPTGGEERAGAADGDAGGENAASESDVEECPVGETAAGVDEAVSAAEPPAGESAAPETVAGDAASGGVAHRESPNADGMSGGRRRPWRTVAIGLGSAVGVAGIAVLSVFIYSIVDDDSGGWSTYEYSIVDDDSGGWFAPGRLDEDRRLDRDDERGDGRDRPVEVPRHHEGAGRAGDNGRPGNSAGHPDGTGGDKADGYEDAPAAAASNGCVEVQDLGRGVLLLCDRAHADGVGFEWPRKHDEEPPGLDLLDGDRFRGWEPWDAQPGSRWPRFRRWLPEGGPPNPRKFLGGLPGEDFFGLAPMDCREIPPWGTSPEGGAASGIECVTPSAAYAKYCIGLRHLPDDVLRDIECVTPSAAFCMGREVDGPRGFGFEECYGFAGDFPPDWPGLEGASPGGWFPFPPDGSPGDDDYAYAEDFGYAFEDGYPEGGARTSRFLEGWPAGPEQPFGVPSVGFDFETLVELLPYVLGGEMFEEFLGSILEGLLSGFEGLPEGAGDFDFGFGARDELDSRELLGGLDDEFLGLILQGLVTGFEGSPEAGGGLAREGFEDAAPDVSSEEWLEELFGSLRSLFGDLDTEGPVPEDPTPPPAADPTPPPAEDPIPPPAAEPTPPPAAA